MFFACIMLKLDEYEIPYQSIRLSKILGFQLPLTLNSTDIHEKIRDCYTFLLLLFDKCYTYNYTYMKTCGCSNHSLVFYILYILADLKTR